MNILKKLSKMKEKFKWRNNLIWHQTDYLTRKLTIKKDSQYDGKGIEKIYYVIFEILFLSLKLSGISGILN